MASGAGISLLPARLYSTASDIPMRRREFVRRIARLFETLSRGETKVMARMCEVCGKKPVFGNNVSHAHNVTSRRWLPNLQKVRAVVDGGVKRIKVCTRCIRSGKIQKAVR